MAAAALPTLDAFAELPAVATIYWEPQCCNKGNFCQHVILQGRNLKWNKNYYQFKFHSFIKCLNASIPPLEWIMTCDPTPYLVIPTTNLCSIGYRNILESVPVSWKCTCGHHHITAAAAANIISRKLLIILYPVRCTTRWHFFLQLCWTALKSLQNVLP